MAAAKMYEGSSGKLRRLPLRRAAETPYDRPATEIPGLRIQAAAVAENKGWLWKLASRIFSRLTPPRTHQNLSPKVWKPCGSDAVNLVNNSSADGAQHILNSDANGISELEILLKQKTFTSLRSNGSIPTPATSLTIPEEEFTSRAEVGKEYMGSRPSRAPSSALSLRNQLFQEDALPSIIPYGRQISQISTAPRFVTHFSGICEPRQNGYMTRKPIGRSAMHRMSRSPYFGATSATNIKIHKRGCSVLDNDLGCQKSDLRFPSKNTQWSHGKDKLDAPSDSDLQKPGSSISLKQGKIANTDESGLCISGVELIIETVGAVNPTTATDAKADLQKATDAKADLQKPGSSISLEQGKIANTDELGPWTSGVELIETVGAIDRITAIDAKDGLVAVSSGRRAGFQMRAPEIDFDLDDDNEDGSCFSPGLGPVAQHHPRDSLPLLEFLENKVGVQAAEMQRIARENRRLAGTHAADEFGSQASASTPTLSTAIKRSRSMAFEGDAVARVSKKLCVEVAKAEKIASGEPSTYGESLGCADCCDVGFPRFIQWKHCPQSTFH